LAPTANRRRSPRRDFTTIVHLSKLSGLDAPRASGRKESTMSKPKYAPPSSPEAAIAELEMLAEQNANELYELEVRAPTSGDYFADNSQLPEPEMISIGELLLLNVETRIGRIADALETANKIKAAGRNDIAGLTEGVNRLADAFEAMAGFIGCITESVEGADGISRCYVRTNETIPNVLSFRDDRD
jgi:hypothetical protein